MEREAVHGAVGTVGGGHLRGEQRVARASSMASGLVFVLLFPRELSQLRLYLRGCVGEGWRPQDSRKAQHDHLGGRGRTPR